MYIVLLKYISRPLTRTSCLVAGKPTRCLHWLPLIVFAGALIIVNSAVCAVRGSACGRRCDHVTGGIVQHGGTTSGYFSSRDTQRTSLWQRLAADWLRRWSGDALETRPLHYHSCSSGERYQLDVVYREHIPPHNHERPVTPPSECR